ncbi:peptidylprolyl isomerase [Pseudorhodobacter sp. W20_MBD10_FR17]|uniref:peptidylprolyl isomerase n=1 Tax=Pseudorhodobacter sp. W20_MBD10_FR17 TaxID=3240266 RepID=UPI003F9DCA77
MTPTIRVPQLDQITAERLNDPCQEKKSMIRPLSFALALSTLLVGAAPLQAQNLFAPRMYVNDSAITEFEVQQRLQMLKLFRTPGDLEEAAIKALVEDRLRMTAAKAMKLTVTPEQIKAGMEEFAGRANMTADQFVAALAQEGVAAETFRDFVEAGLLWRQVAQQKYIGKVTVSDAEIDRAIAMGNSSAALRILISELVIPAPAGQEEAVMARAAQLRSQIRSEADFAAAARKYSASQTAGRGGRIDWMPLANLPAALAPVVLGLAPGEVSQPVALGGAVGLFQLRGLEKMQDQGLTSISVDYAQYTLPAATGVAEAAAIRAKVDTCDDLYTIAKGQPADRLIRETKAATALPTNVGRALAALDPGESVDFPSGAAHVFLMLCSRTPEQEVQPTRDEVRERVLNQKFGAMAQTYLEEMRFNAIIRKP